MASLRLSNGVLLVAAILLAAASSALAAAAPGVWDLETGNAVIQPAAGTGAATYAQTYAMVKSGFADFAWNGPGINSSAAASSGSTALGIVFNYEADFFGGPIWTDKSQLTPDFNVASWAGPTVDTTLIKYTYYGDANLDGVVYLVDIDNWIAGEGSSKGWYFGDFDYNGVVNLADIDAWIFGQGSQGAPLSGGSVSAVPEPSSIVFVVAFLAALGAFFVRKRSV
jgi:hypothetical protein